MLGSCDHSAGSINRCAKHPMFLFSLDGSRRGTGAAEEPAKGEGGAGPLGCPSWLRSSQPADGTAKNTGRTESGDDQCN